MTTEEYIQLKKELLVEYNKAARRYGKLATAYAEKYKRQSQRCNQLIRDIDQLKNSIKQ